MSSTRHLINVHMAALIDGPFGCLDSAAETINARLGLSVCKGTLSKRLSGQYGWPADQNANSENWADAVHEIDEGIEALRRARSLAEKRMVDAA